VLTCVNYGIYAAVTCVSCVLCEDQYV